MLRVLITRTSWALVTLAVVCVATFVVFERIPGSRAVAAIAAERDATPEDLRRTRIRFGEIDPVTGRERGSLDRFSAWLSRAVRLEPAPGLDAERYRQRILAALRVTFFLGLSTLAVALIAGIALGAWLGFRVGSVIDRSTAGALLSINALPEFLFGTLLTMGLVIGLGAFPPGGLRTPGSSEWTAWAQIVDLFHHAALPVATMAIGPVTTITMLVRDAVDRTRKRPFVQALREFGMPEARVRRRVLRHSLGPLATQLGTLIPMLLVGSVVVEQMFALPGLGRMFVDAVLQRDTEAATTFTLLSSILVLAALIASDLIHRSLDPAVKLR